jgi:hypothetical protein
VAEYDSLSKKVNHLYTLKEMVLPEDEIKIYDEQLETRLADTNQQLKKWILRWKPVIEHSMKRVKELAQKNSKPIWQHFTAKQPAKQPAKTTVSRKTATRSKAMTKRMYNNPLTNVYKRIQKKRSSSRVIPATKQKYRMNHIISKMYTKLGEKISTSRAKTILEVELQTIDDRFGDEPM